MNIFINPDVEQIKAICSNEGKMYLSSTVSQFKGAFLISQLPFAAEGTTITSDDIVLELGDSCYGAGIFVPENIDSDALLNKWEAVIDERFNDYLRKRIVAMVSEYDFKVNWERIHGRGGEPDAFEILCTPIRRTIVTTIKSRK